MKFLSLVTTVSLLGFSATLSAQQPQSKSSEKKLAAPSAAQSGKQKAPAAKPPAPKTEASKPKAKAKPEPKKYVIKSGDNPWTIAQAHGVDHAELLSMNDIEDPKNMKIGDVILLPKGVASKNAPKKEVAKPEAAPAAGPQSGDGWEMYTIKSGDNPWSIAKKLKLDHQKIISLNEGTDFRDLKIGQQIKIPKKS